jgi:prepilin-type N-terminal cleavage/methylation domain-containing protein
MNIEKNTNTEGFSLVEVLVGIAIVAIALLGLAQLFTYSVMSNSRAERMSGATFLAQQQVDFHRNLTADELGALSGATTDELIDVNLDGSNDFRRVTQIQQTGIFWEIQVLVFSSEQLDTDLSALVHDPQQYRVKASVNTIISR